VAELVVITDCDHPDVDIERAVFGSAGLDVRLADCRTEADVLAAGADARALLVQYAPVSATVLAGLPHCQVVGRYGTGLDPIDVPAARDRGLEVVSVPDYSIQEVSDHAVALIMALCRGVVTAAGAVRAGRWSLADAGPVRRLETLRLGVIGLGRIGQAVARKAAALGFDVVGCDVAPPRVSPVSLLGLEDLLRTSDVVTLHVPLSDRTRHMIGASRLALMRPTAFLVNTARGGLVDQAALRAALAAGALAGAGLDVLEAEPPDPADPLLTDERVIITPHVAFYSAQSLVELKRRVATGIIEALARRRSATPEDRPRDASPEGRPYATSSEDLSL
jgi:D-3-phosphoglycerate dehydrogenase / 2-oxoglutarate reductase